MTNDITEGTTTLTAADGFTLEAFRATPAGTPRGGLVILQEIFGITDQLKGVVRVLCARRLRHHHPRALRPRRARHGGAFRRANRGRDLAYGLPLDKVMLDVAAAAQRVRGPHGVSVLGFCWGGGVIVRAAAEIDLRGAIAFYGTRLPTYLDCKPKCPLLFHFGETDPNSTPEIIAQVRQALPAAETHLYEAGHAFANDVRPTYVAAAADAARARTLGFLARVHA